MMTKPKHYKTVTGCDESELDHKVNKLLAEGFELYGAPYGFPSADSRLCQAVTHEEIGGPAKFDPATQMPTR